ncbi:MAG TPA: S41 family peptidase [Terracidiphilus sp.]|nr:S41 family peptidase [Terracidiphilus sp.]
MRFRGIGTPALILALSFSAFPANLIAQQGAAPAQISSSDLQRAHLMLRQAYDEIRKNYYDTSYHGVDLDKVFQQYNTRLDASKSVNETFRVIGAFVLNLHDSHTFFMPPTRTNRSTPGFSMQIIGDKCFVTRIRPGTDAAAKLHVGDQVLALNGFKIAPENFHDLEYFIQVLSPAPTEIVDLQSATGEHRQETIKATVRSGKQVTDLTGGGEGGDFWQLVRDSEEDEHLSRSRIFETGDVFVWRMPTFEVPPPDVDRVAEKAMKSKTLIIDLRGNSGGYIDTLKTMLGHFVDHEVKLGDRVTRKETKPEMVKPRSSLYTGNVIVLVDHNSAFAAELFARVIQLEHKGKVIGDRSAGAVMEAKDFEESTGTDYKVFYGLSITSANILMSDGKSLENTGVAPDEVLIPSAADLAAGKDPVLAHAAEVGGAKLDPGAAGKLFPYEWPSL